MKTGTKTAAQLRHEIAGAQAVLDALKIRLAKVEAAADGAPEPVCGLGRHHQCAGQLEIRLATLVQT